MEIKVKSTNYSISNKTFAVIILSLIAFTFFVGIAVGRGEKEIVINQIEESEEIEEVVIETIKVYVTGCVNEPGIFEVEKGSILNDIINKAGGLKKEACTKINLVYRISENVMINIRSEAEVTALENPVDYDKTPGNAQIASEDGEQYEGLININTASSEELCQLPGVGEATAQKIIAYRKKNGEYEKKEDIMNVDGIKQSRYDSIKDCICVK